MTAWWKLNCGRKVRKAGDHLGGSAIVLKQSGDSAGISGNGEMWVELLRGEERLHVKSACVVGWGAWRVSIFHVEEPTGLRKET